MRQISERPSITRYVAEKRQPLAKRLAHTQSHSAPSDLCERRPTLAPPLGAFGIPGMLVAKGTRRLSEAYLIGSASTDGFSLGAISRCI